MGAMIRSHRRGSALLIVLGMLAFMVASAVAFSAYMRASRVPSSYLRQTIASRLLVKAALASAIEEIDSVIGNNPHPGVGINDYRPNAFTGVRDKFSTNKKLVGNRNYWTGRVYTGGTNSTLVLQQEDTVSPLCLEALAYIPPPIINEARYYSRHSSSAQWHQMGFDSGRYAFCALDVSDYFDVNVVHAGFRSAEYDNRFSLAYLFEDEKHENVEGDPDKWDEELKTFRNGSLPLVSLAHLNIAMGNAGFGGVKSPFFGFLETSSMTESLSDARKMPFVTDGYFPLDSRIGYDLKKNVFDLADDKCQPFPNIKKPSYEVSYLETVENGINEAATRISEFIPRSNLAMLYDYLDADSVPFSLSMPTVEQNPMICGIEPQTSDMSVKFDDSQSQPLQEVSQPERSADGYKRKVSQKIVIKASIDGFPRVNVMTLYPFRRSVINPSRNYSLWARLALFATKDGVSMPFRGSVGTGANDPPLYFPASDNKGDGRESAKVKKGVAVYVTSAKGAPGINADITKRDDALFDNPSQIDLDSQTDIGHELAASGNEVLSATCEWEQKCGVNPSTGDPDGDWEPTFKDMITKNEGRCDAACNFPALTSAGAIDGDFSKTGHDLVKVFLNGVDLKFHCALWVHEKLDSKDGMKSVDLVPAYYKDDELNTALYQDEMGIQEGFGESQPWLKFTVGNSFKLKLSDQGMLDSASAAVKIDSVSPEAIMCRDPRYNYAPENWFQCSSGEFNKNSWLANAGEKKADGDIFLQVSNQGRLQSIYELANLPRLVDKRFRDMENGDQGKLPKPETFGKSDYGKAGEEVNASYFWKTYDPFGRYTGGPLNKQELMDYKGDPNNKVSCIGDGFEAMGFVSDGGGYKMNPYATPDMLAGAFLNTPHDWRASLDSASTDKNAWRAGNTMGAITWPSLAMVATNFYNDLRAELPNGDLLNSFWDEKKNPADEKWEAIFKHLGWYYAGEPQAEFLPDREDSKECCPLPNGDEYKLYNTDKKFLYGFWHDCFAVKQQLFLVFVRAEPTMMGGGMINQTPPQLGARAVALVWRDPTKSKDNDTPHATRILFYRQFD